MPLSYRKTLMIQRLHAGQLNLRVKRSLEDRGFAKPKLEFKKQGQIWSLEKIYSKLPDVRRMHVRGFRNDNVECEDETLLPNHFGVIVKPSPCSTAMVEEIERSGYYCSHENHKTTCRPRSSLVLR